MRVPSKRIGCRTTPLGGSGARLTRGGRPLAWKAGRQDASAKVSLGSWAEFNAFVVRGYQADGSGGPGGPCMINCNNLYSAYAFHSGGANVLLADGSARFVQQAASATVVAALITRAGGEVIPGNEF